MDLFHCSSCKIEIFHNLPNLGTCKLVALVETPVSPPAFFNDALTLAMDPPVKARRRHLDANSLFGDALKLAMEPPVHTLPYTKVATARGKGKARPKVAGAKRARGFSSPLLGKVQKHFGEAKSYIRSADETGVMRCRWHLTRKKVPDHFELTQAMWGVVLGSAVSVDELKAIETAIKGGLRKKAAMKLIHNAKARAVERDPDAVPDGPASCSDDEGDDFDKDDDDDSGDDEDDSSDRLYKSNSEEDCPLGD